MSYGRFAYAPAIFRDQQSYLWGTGHCGGFYQKLLGRGKAKMQALVAATRKLLHARNGIFKNHLTYVRARLFASTVPPEAASA